MTESMCEAFLPTRFTISFEGSKFAPELVLALGHADGGFGKSNLGPTNEMHLSPGWVWFPT